MKEAYRTTQRGKISQIGIALGGNNLELDIRTLQHNGTYNTRILGMVQDSSVGKVFTPFLAGTEEPLINHTHNMSI